MYFGYGPPKTLVASLTGGSSSDSADEWLYLQQDDQHLVAVSEDTVQLW